LKTVNIREEEFSSSVVAETFAKGRFVEGGTNHSAATHIWEEVRAFFCHAGCAQRQHYTSHDIHPAIDDRPR
jgi:hypothetical protein